MTIAPVPAVHGAADVALSDTTRQRIRDGVPANTARAYTGARRRFHRWCETNGRCPLPATGETLAEYVAHLLDADKSRSTIKQAMSAIRTEHRVAGHEGAPSTEAADLVLRGGTRERAQRGRRTRQAPPVTLPVLRAMVESLDVDTVAGCRDHALLVLGFTAFARRSELAGLHIEDLTETDAGFDVWIRAAKTDKTGEGQETSVPRGSHPDTDVVTVVKRWLRVLAERGITSGPLLRRIDRHGNVGGAMSGDAVSGVVRRCAQQAEVGRADDYSGHSLRAGAATTALDAGKPFALVCEAGRWVEGSQAVGGYHRAISKRKHHPLAGTGL